MIIKFIDSLPKKPYTRWKIRVFDENNHFYKCGLRGGLSGIVNYSRDEALEDYVNLVCDECDNLDMVSVYFGWLRVK